ncbi:MAG: helix-turn-helix domain-containing protein, partial [Proteobacteria bacterium]|nr:helix-turn-helix domain-containing protein [Pseudomonadota bacterium]
MAAPIMTGPRLSIIPARAVYDVSLKPAELRVLAALCCHVDNTGQCWPSIRQIAKRLGHGNHRH